MLKRTILVAGLSALTGMLLGGTGLADQGDILAPETAFPTAATGCSISLATSYPKGTTIDFIVDATGGSFVDYNATVIVALPFSGNKYNKLINKVVAPTTVSGIGIDAAVPNWGAIGGTALVVAIVRESGRQHVCYDTTTITP